MTATDTGKSVSDDVVITSTGFVHSVEKQRPTQPPLFHYGPTIWDRPHRDLTWQEVARALPAGLGLEYTADGWRIIVVPVETRRALEALEVAEGDVIPEPVRIEAARRRALAEDQLAQARAVLRTLQAEAETAEEMTA